MLTLAADAPIAAHSVRCALLVTDLVDSTQLFARLGEYAATQLLNTEEDAARRLARHFDGQEIDRSDGFLLLFEQPWQAVAFALAYHHELDGLSRRSGVRLQAKIGIHWAEVYLTRHSVEDIAQGAKPIEVGGVGKPIAARLMTAARAGQVLLSASAREVAEAACRAHADQCGELDWVAHGRYRLKGVDLPLELHEVFPRGAALPREPLENDKVVSLRRESRRRLLKGGAALAAGLGLPALGIGWYRYTRFDFPKSGWLVLADWFDAGGNGELVRVLGIAFRIALEQSRFAYVLNDEAVRDTLRRMRQDVATLTDRGLAIEVAQREQAKALVMPAISAIDIGLRLSATVIDPWKNRLVFSVDVASPNSETLTRALDDLAAAVRTSLGESLEAIVADSRPLAKVTTTDMGALRLYTEAELKVRERRPAEAAELLKQAIALDADFASAYAKLGTVQMIHRVDPRQAEANWREAMARTDRLTRREQMYVEACLSNTGTPEDMRARWGGMHAVFPEDAAAGNNACWIAWSHFGQVAEALKIQTEVVRLAHPWRPRAQHNLGYLQMIHGDLDAALATFEESLEAADDPIHYGIVRVLLARGDGPAAEALLQRYARDAQSPPLETERIEAAILHAAHRGDFALGRRLAASLARRADDWDFVAARKVALRSELLLALAEGDEAAAQAAFDAFLVVLRSDLADDVGGAMVVPRMDLYLLALLAQRHGWDSRNAELGPLLPLSGRWRSFPQLQASRLLLDGWRALADGGTAKAIEIAGESRLRAPLFLANELELEARRLQGEPISQHALDLARQLPIALGEAYNYFSTQLPNLLFWRRLRQWV